MSTPWQPQWQPVAAKPGCVPLRPLGVGDIIDGSFAAIRRNPRVMIGSSLVIAVIQGLALAGFQWAIYNARAGTTSGYLVGQLSSTFSLVVVSTLLGAILTGMLAAVVTEDVLGIKLTLPQAWARARRRFWPLIGLALLSTLAEVLGLIPFFVLGIWLWGIWAVAVPVMMVEGATIRGSLRRSKDLSSGMFWRVWGIRALGALLAAVVGGLLAAPFQIAGYVIDGLHPSPGTVPVAFILLSALGTILSTAIVAPVRAGIDSLLYVDLRMRKEGLDLVLQQQAAQPRATRP